jgi:hypothetical protein
MNALLGLLIFAETITLSWTNPTETITYTPAGPYTNPAGTRIWMLVADVNDPDATSFTLSSQPPGEYIFVATSYDDEGHESQVSGKATKTVSSFKALANSTVYQVVTIKNGFWTLPIGTLSADTECIVDHMVNGKYAVPQDNVVWAEGSSARPPLVVADCE